MYYITKRIEVAYAHLLSLDYTSKCRNLHGHNGVITLYCCAESLNDQGMVMDFTHIKQMVQEKLDHKCLNDVFDFNPTAENLARWLCDQVPQCYKVTFQESEGNVAAYVKPGYEHVCF